MEASVVRWPALGWSVLGWLGFMPQGELMSLRLASLRSACSLRSVRAVLYSTYERRLQTWLLSDQVARHHLPRHVGVILDGNRRWARQARLDVSEGHRQGARTIDHLLQWCSQVGVEVVTLWLLSTDNLNRSAGELAPLLATIETVVQQLASAQRWRVHPVGALDRLPQHTQQVLLQAQHQTATVQGVLVNVAVGYGGRQEIADAVRSLLREHAQQGTSMQQLADELEVEHIASHLYTQGQPDPDLVIRTSGEQRLSGFLLWQSAHSEFYFCEAYWPDFRRVDFLRALRDYATRQRRLGL